MLSGGGRKDGGTDGASSERVSCGLEREGAQKED
jgi:hypothetical protein